MDREMFGPGNAVVLGNFSVCFRSCVTFLIDAIAIQVYMAYIMTTGKKRFKIDDSNFDKDSIFVVFLSWVAHKKEQIS